MTPSDEEVANELMNKFQQEGLPDDLGYRIAIRPYILEALREQRKKVIEDCAKVRVLVEALENIADETSDQCTHEEQYIHKTAKEALNKIN